MTHSLDEDSPRFLTQAFHESVQGLIAARGIRFTAEQLKMIGVSFETAYELIFNCTPRDWGVLEMLKLHKAAKEADINRPSVNLAKAKERLSGKYPKE